MDKSYYENIARSIGRIEGHQEEIIARLGRINGKIDDHSNKIGKLQTAQSVLKTKATMLGAVAGAVLIGIIEFTKSQFK